MIRNDTGQVYVQGQDTAPNVTDDCKDYPCDQHYVVRLDGTWVRAFHNEVYAQAFADQLRELVNR